MSDENDPVILLRKNIGVRIFQDFGMELKQNDPNNLLKISSNFIIQCAGLFVSENSQNLLDPLEVYKIIKETCLITKILENSKPKQVLNEL